MGDVLNSRDREEKKRTWVRKGGERENWFFPPLSLQKKMLHSSQPFTVAVFSKGPKCFS